MPEMPEMPLLQELHHGADAHEQRAQELVREQQRLLELERMAGELARGATPRGGASIEAVRKEIEGAERRIGGLRRTLAASDARLADLRDRLATAVDPRKAIAGLSAAYPILLFPVRLETRFVSGGQGAGGKQLLVRIYPDDCSVDSFEPELSVSEVKNLRRYWCGLWRAGGDEGRERAAWRELCAAHGAGRALYLIGRYQPLATSDPRPARPAGAGAEVTLVIPVDAPVAERAAVSDYWIRAWRGDAAGAWAELVGRVGEARAEALRTEVAPFNALEALPAGSDRATVPVAVLFVAMTAVGEAATKRQAWTRPARATCLPERFVLVAESSAERVVELGAVVPQPLVVGPDPLAEGDAQFGRESGDLHIPPALRWMTDFEAALRVGMAWRIDLSTRQATSGFDRLYVVGVRLGANPERAKSELETLLQHHAASQAGFALLPQGTPTNNSEEGSSGWARTQEADELFELSRSATTPSVAPRFDAGATDPYAKADGLVLAEALGIDPAILQRVPHAEGRDQAEARAMNAALWPATLGYFMDTQLRPVFSDEVILRTRRHFIDRVSGRGVVPAIRIGKQPYGILAAAAVSRLQLEEPYLASLKGHLGDLQPLWTQFGDSAPRVGVRTDDPQRTLLDLLGLHPSSVEFHLHILDSADRIWNGASFDRRWAALRIVLRQRMEAEMQAGRDLLASLGYRGDDPEIIEKFFAHTSGPQQRPTIDDAPLSETELLPPCTGDGKNYIGWCRDRAERVFDELVRQIGFTGGRPPNALLYHMLRHALQLGYHHEAVGMKVRASVLAPSALGQLYREPPFVHLATDKRASESRYEVLYTPEPAVTGQEGLSVARFIPRWIQGEGRTSALREQLAALAVLETAPTARLERAFAEHVDLSSYRWDAWWSSLVHQKLHELRWPNRQERRAGLYLGAFGWVESLKPDSGVRSHFTPAGELAQVFGSAPLERDSQNGGHVLAPSTNHAVTAAVLRAGYLANATPRDPELLAVDLSSARVRVALQFLEGVRNGQPLGALLGYQLERRLHDRHDERELDFLIHQIRKAFPLVAKRLTETSGGDAESAPIEAVEARNVCDGLRLTEHVRTGSIKSYPWGKNLARASSRAEAIVDEEVRALSEIRDAIADLAIAEAVHQSVMGQSDRAAAALDAFSKGGFPPEPEVVRTPRSGVTLTHRLALHLSASATAASGATPRAAAEPAVDAWLSEVLPPLGDVVIRVKSRNMPPGSGDELTDVSLATLGLSATDVIHVLDFGDEAAMNELDDRLLDHIIRARTLCPDATVELAYTEPVPGKTTVFELGPLVGALRELLLSARALKASDAALQQEASGAGDAGATIAASVLTSAREALTGLEDDVATRLGLLSPLADETTPIATVIAGIDAEVSAFVALQQRASLVGVTLSSAGHALRGVRDWFGLVRRKARETHAAWADKLDEHDQAFAAGADTTRTDAARMTSLVQAERAVSTIQTSPLPALGLMTSAVAARRTAFTQARQHLAEVADSAATTIEALWAAWSATFAERTNLDATVIDTRDEETRLRVLAADLVRQLGSLGEELGKRVKRADELVADAAVKSGAAQVELRAEAAKALFGDGFRLLPRFALPRTQADEWRTAWTARVSLLGPVQATHDFPVDDWLYGVARVRPKMHALEQTLALTAAFERSEPVLVPLQFPHRPDEPWLALELPADLEPAELGERVLYSAIYPGGAFDADATQVGLLLDEWTEVIPSRQETAGLAFHYDRPSTEPPQAMLLVTPATPGQTWRWDDLERAIPETFALARTRAAEPRQLAATPLSRFLPATLMATSALPISIGTRLRTFDVLFSEVSDDG